MKPHGGTTGKVIGIHHPGTTTVQNVMLTTRQYHIDRNHMKYEKSRIICEEYQLILNGV